jgi:hypothetical protein
MIIQVAILIFIIFVLTRVAARFGRGDITGREFGIWLIFWLLVGTATVLPKSTDVVAQAVGVERGADLLVYLSVIVLFFVIFKVLVRLERLDREITKLVRGEATRKAERPKDE